MCWRAIHSLVFSNSLVSVSGTPDSNGAPAYSCEMCSLVSIQLSFRERPVRGGGSGTGAVRLGVGWVVTVVQKLMHPTTLPHSPGCSRGQAADLRRSGAWLDCASEIGDRVQHSSPLANCSLPSVRSHSLALKCKAQCPRRTQATRGGMAGRAGFHDGQGRGL